MKPDLKFSPVIKMIITVIIPALVLVSCKRVQNTSREEIAVPVSVQVVQPGTIEQYINTTGTVYPASEVTLSSQMAGEYYLNNKPGTGRKFVLGDHVKKGETIIRLEDDEYRNNLRERSKTIDNELSKMEYEKLKVLYGKGGATFRELKDAEIKVINSMYDSVNINIQLAKMSVNAPFDGRIVALPYYTQGVKVASNKEMVKLMNYSKLYLEVGIPEKYFTSIQEGQDVYISNYTLPDDTLKGKVTQVSPAVDPASRTFKCFIVADNSREKMLPGMFVNADIVSARSTNALVLPKEIVSGRGADRYVFVVDNNYAFRRRISTGLETLRTIEVTSGLQQGERVVIKGAETLRERARVKVLE